MKHFILGLLIIFSLTFAESLFQVKATNGRTVLDVTSDGLIVLNPNSTAPGVDDTLMIITNSQMKSFVSGTGGKGLAKSVSIVATSNLKGTITKVLEVTNANTKMREGDAGNQYTNFNPQNIFVGLNAGINTVPQPANDQGINNVFLGNQTGTGNISGAYNVCVGASAGATFTAGKFNTYVGLSAGMMNKFSSFNTFLGCNAGALNELGSSNTFLGLNTGRLFENGSQNTFVGSDCGEGGPSVPGTTVTASGNTFMGFKAGYLISGGNYNVAIGNYAGYNNTAGSSNVFLGYQAGQNETGSNRLYIDKTGTATPLIYGRFDERRIVINGNDPKGQNFFVTGTAGGASAWTQIQKDENKHNVTTIASALDKITQLRGVKYQYQETDSSTSETKIGFVASEVEKILPEIAKKSGDSYSMQSESINAVLVEAVKELNQQNIMLKKELEEIKQLIKK